MPRKFTEKKLVLASHNKGKIAELTTMFAPYGVEVIGGGVYNLEEPIEDGNSFVANAEIKSRYFMEHTNEAALADDSGLVVPALDGAPGIYSARWGGEQKDFGMAMQRVKEELEGRGLDPEGQSAYFACVLLLTWPDGYSEIVEGRAYGTLTFPPRGEKGFGYDPIFIPEGEECTFAEMPAEKKHTMSHRAHAFHLLMEGCFE